MSVALQWDANTEPDLAGYTIFQATMSLLGHTTGQALTNPSIDTYAVSASTTVYSVAGLQNATSYYFRMAAYNSGGVYSGLNVDNSALASEVLVFQLSTATISGSVKTAGGAGISGVTLTLSGSSSTVRTSDGSGNFQFVNLPQTGSYTVTPSRAGYSFAPVNMSTGSLINTINDWNFTGTVLTSNIGGSVKTAGGAGISGVTLTLSGSSSTVVTSDGSGNYQFANLPRTGSYTVTPSRAGYSFAPVSLSTGSLANTVNNWNFTGTLIASIGGSVKTAGGAGISGVTLTLSGSSSTVRTSDGSGNYQFANLPQAGSYTVTPTRAGYSFAPVNLSTGSLTNTISTWDFTGTPLTASISGSVKTAGGAAISGVTLTLSGSSSTVRTSDASGNYQFANLPQAGSYTVTPTRAGYSFAPVNLSTGSLTNTISTWHFTGTLTASIGGSVKTPDGAGLSGVTLTLSGSSSTVRTSDGSGNYQFANLPRTGSYTVTPTRAGYSFVPVSLSTGSLTNTISTWHFTATVLTASISGSVKTASGVALSGVTLTLSGSSLAVAISDASGNYHFSGLTVGGSYSVSPSKTDYSFAPVSLSTGALAGDITAWNYIGAAQTANAVRARETFLSPGTADGMNDVATFGPDAEEVTVYDVRGREYFHATAQSETALVWNCRNASGEVVPGGAYIARIRARSGFIVYQKFAIIK